MPDIAIPAAAGAGLGAAVVAGAIYAGHYIYKSYTNLPKYTPAQVSDLAKLIEYHQRYIKKPVPVEWTLKEGRPTHRYNFELESDRLITEISRLSLSSAHISEATKGVLNVIAQLFSSFDKRKFGKLSGTSIEGFFFTDLAQLVITRFPEMRFDVPEDLIELENIAQYCELVYRYILKGDPRVVFELFSPGPRNNPIQALKEITVNLTAVIESTQALNHEMTFTGYIEQLDNAVSSMAAQSFHIMYLLTKGKQAHQPNLPVVVFLDGTQTHRPWINEYREQRLAIWLKQTLDVAGIKCNDFKNTKIPTLAATDRHLEGECISDAGCVLPRELLDAKHRSWGHWPFSIIDGMTPPESQRAVEKQLNLVREIYRGVLKLYHLRSLLVCARKIAPTDGESWLYGDETGLKMVSTLLLAAQKLIDSLNTSLDGFMRDYIAKFDTARGTSGVRTDSDEYIAVTAAIKHFKGGESALENGFNSHYKKAKDVINAIKDHCDGYKVRKAPIEESKRQLLSDLIEFLRYSGNTGDEAYLVLKAALREKPSTLAAYEALQERHRGVVGETERLRSELAIKEEAIAGRDATIVRLTEAREHLLQNLEILGVSTGIDAERTEVAVEAVPHRAEVLAGAGTGATRLGIFATRTLAPEVTPIVPTTIHAAH